MEVSALKQPALTLRGPTPLLRLQSDERLVALTRRGNQAAFEALVGRYEARLLSFCRHMLGSREDAEDVLQEVFAAAFNAMLADERAINVRPWLYRIARNRSLNHLRRQQAIGVDSMDVHLAEQGTTTADKVHKREDFRELMTDVGRLPETQRTALLLREIDALSYEQIAEAMETTVPSVKSLLVRARVSLAEAAEARRLSCEEVRQELGEVAEGLRRTSPPVRRHLRTCDRCAGFRKQLKQTNRALAAVFPVGPLVLIKKLVLAQLGTTASAGGAGAAAGTAAAGTVSVGAASTLSAGVGAIATKTAAGLAAAPLGTPGAVEVDHAATRVVHHPAPAPVQVAQVPQAAPAPAAPAASTTHVTQPAKPARQAPGNDTAHKAPKPKPKPAAKTAATPATTTPAPTTTTPSTTTATPAGTTTQEVTDTTAMPPQGGSGSSSSSAMSTNPDAWGQPQPASGQQGSPPPSGSDSGQQGTPPSSGSGQQGTPPPSGSGSGSGSDSGSPQPQPQPQPAPIVLPPPPPLPVGVPPTN